VTNEKELQPFLTTRKIRPVFMESESLERLARGSCNSLTMGNSAIAANGGVPRRANNESRYDNPSGRWLQEDGEHARVQRFRSGFNFRKQLVSGPGPMAPFPHP